MTQVTNIRERRPWDEQLRELGDALVDHPARAQLGAMLSFLRQKLGATHALVVQDGQVAAQAGVETGPDGLAEGAAFLLADLAAEQGAAVRVDDTRVAPFGTEEERQRLYAAGLTGAICVPLQHRSIQHGSIVLWFGEEFEEGAEPSELPANYILSAVRQLLTLAFERDTRSVSAEGTLSSLGEVNRLASLGMVLESATFALRGPSSSMLIQIDELRRLTEEIGILVDPTDHALADALGNLSQTLDDITLAASLVRRELTNLSDLSTSHEKREIVQLSRLIHEAVVIARPELEQRGFTVQERISHESYVEGDRHELLHLVLGLLFAWTREERVSIHKPVLEVQLEGNEDTGVLRVAALLQKNAEPPVPPAACLRIVETHRGHLKTLPGALEVSFATRAGGSLRPQSKIPKIKRVLLIDDDPMFTRALRRALSPHDVRVCGTAAEAEIALMAKDYDPDMVICDLWLPGTNGRTLHEKVAATQPSVAPRFVFVSGAPVSSKDVQYFAASGCQTLAKPIQVSDLLALLDSDAMCADSNAAPAQREKPDA